MREVVGLSGMAVAAELHWSQSKVSRIEAGRLGVSLSDLSALLRTYGASEEVTAELLTMAAAGDGKSGAWIVQAGGSVRRQGEVAAIEARVHRIRQYAPTFMPGLLQSPAYTEAMARVGNFGDPAALVKARSARQSLLAQPHGPAFQVVLDQRALQRWPGDVDTLREQVEMLLMHLEQGRVDLRLLPNGSAQHAIGLAQFLLYDFKEPVGRSVVMLESQTADTYLSADSDIAVYGKLFEDLAASALSPADSGEYLTTLLRRIAA